MMQNYAQNNMNFQNMKNFQNNNMLQNPSNNLVNNINSNNNKNQNNNGNNIFINNDNDNDDDNANDNEFIPKTTISKKEKIEILIDYMVKPRGLENVGATCYMNATLQCFYHVRPLTENLVNDDKITKSLEITNAYRDVVMDLTCCKKKNKFISDRKKFIITGENINFIKPEKFKDIISEKNPQFKGIQANDSKDLIIFLLENMDAELTKRNNKSKVSRFIGANIEYLKKENFKKSHNSIFAELFFGFQKTSLICNSCGQGEESYGIFNFLIFPLEKTYNSLNNNNNNFFNRFNMNNNFVNQFRPLTCININKNKNGKRKLNLNDCFTEYFKPEILSGDNSIYCNTCKKLQEAKNMTEIYLAPHVLILILNRGRGNIFECDVDFPHKLNLNKFIKNPNSPKIFDLIGVISHIGKSSMEGHFIAYCKHFDQTWYLFNDSIVNKVGEEEIKIGTPYILFYQNEEIS
jgi:ubiquitin C-terminal hydrolase